MRKHGDYIPTKKLDFDTWLKNLAAKAEENKDKYGISDNDISYSGEIGREFGIVGPERVFDHENFKPKLKLRRVSGGVEISFNKSQTEGVNIYRKLVALSFRAGISISSSCLKNCNILSVDLQNIAIFVLWERSFIHGINVVATNLNNKERISFTQHQSY